MFTVFELVAAIVAVGAFALATIYGGHLAYARLVAPGLLHLRKNPRAMMTAAAMMLGMSLVLPDASVAAQTTAPTLSFDLSPFFDNLNTYLPIFIGLFGIVGGIAGAMALARYVIGAVVNAFSGGSL